MLPIQKRLTNSFYALLSLPATAMGFALSIQIAVLSWILDTKYALDIHEIGIVWAAGPLAGIFGQVIIGFISDKVWFGGGRRRPFIIVGGILAALMILALPNIKEISVFLGMGSILVVALIVALTLDLAINISFNPTRTLIADVTPEGPSRTKGYTWMQTISGFFGVMAYLMGVVLGNYTLIYIGAIIVLVFSVLPLFFIEEPRVLGVSNEGDKLVSEPKKTNIPQLLKIYLAHAFSWIGVQTMFVFVFAFIKDKFNYTEENAKEIGQVISISFAILNTVGFILPSLVLEPLTEKFGRIKTHFATLLVMSVAYLVIAFFVQDAVMLYIMMAFAGIGWAAIVSLPFAIMTENVSSEKMGLYMGIFNLSVVIPQLFVSLVIGHFIEKAPDKSLIFIISGVSLLISFILWQFVKDNSKKES
ncbi:MAG TPA: MFS transporter [Melioribacteraceae bacterium]|nr:MFS transporter [Melioribacteraceae bacterium]